MRKACTFILFMSCGILGAAEPAMPPMIPTPMKMELLTGTYSIRPGTVIVAPVSASKSGESVARLLKSVVGRLLPVTTDNGGASDNGAIILELSPELKSLGDEGYRLEVQSERVVIRAHKPAGLFYGGQTLRQLLRCVTDIGDAPAPIQCTAIEDKPRFAWRGLMLDPARYFLSIDILKRYVDALATYKLNYLHLHLTDDLGWTMEIKKYPLLTDISRWPMKPASRNRGTYTQAQMKDLVAYAAERHVTIIPEIEMPGHNGVPGWVYRDVILCANNPARTKSWDDAWSPPRVEPCAASPAAHAFYENILREVMEVFPGRYIHLGGDEYYGIPWAECPDCQKLIATEHLKKYDTPEVRDLFSRCVGNTQKYLPYRHLMTRMCDFVSANGRRPVLWDDLAWRGNFPANVLIMQWHPKGDTDCWQCVKTPENPVVEAVKAGRKAIVAPSSHLYFDLQSTLPSVYNFDPMPAGLTPHEQSLVLGPHAPAWNQRPEALDSCVFPRFYALSEIGWSPAGALSWDDFFTRRMVIHERYRASEVMGNDVRRIGQWTPAQMATSEQRVTLAFDASSVVSSSGEYKVALTYQSGADGVNIDWVALLENGKEIVRDTHSGWSGGTKENHIYTLRLAKLETGAAYTVQAQMWIPRGGRDSNGKVVMGWTQR